MPNVTVTERALRDYLRKLIEGRDDNVVTGADIIDEPKISNVNPTVDPSAAETQPDRTNFVPQNKQELRVALHQIVDKVSDEKAPEMYDAIKAALEDICADDIIPPEQDQYNVSPANRRVESMNRTQTLREKFAENVIRQKIRKIIAEGPGGGGMSFSGWPQTDSEGDEFGDVERNRKRLDTVGDVDGDVLKKVAGEFGRSVAGAKRLAHTSEGMAKFIADLMQKEDGSYEIVRLQAANDLIDEFAKVLDPEEIGVLKQNPEHVMETDSYRVFLNKYLTKLLGDAAQQYVEMRPDDLYDESKKWVMREPKTSKLKGQELENAVKKNVDKIAKNAAYEVLNFPTFHEFVQDAWDFDPDRDLVSKGSVDVPKMMDKYTAGNVGRTGKKGEEED